MTTLALLPATAPEIACILGISVRLANARLQDYARRGLAKRTDMAIPPLNTHRGRYPHLWVAVNITDECANLTDETPDEL